MWNLFLKIQKYGITPNQCMILFAFNEGVTPSTCEAADMLALFEEGYITKEKSITPQLL